MCSVTRGSSKPTAMPGKNCLATSGTRPSISAMWISCVARHALCVRARARARVCAGHAPQAHRGVARARGVMRVCPGRRCTTGHTPARRSVSSWRQQGARHAPGGTCAAPAPAARRRRRRPLPARAWRAPVRGTARRGAAWRGVAPRGMLAWCVGVAGCRRRARAAGRGGRSALLLPRRVSASVAHGAEHRAGASHARTSSAHMGRCAIISW
jgi:hypothetical protein